MKVHAQAISFPAVAEKHWGAVIADLVKARLTVLVLLTTLVGFSLGSGQVLDLRLMFHALAGTALLACGASALNQVVEREYDAKMRRTAYRPLPSGRMQPQSALILGIASVLLGVLYLVVLVNALSSLLGALTAAIYLFIYTPLKRVTWLNTWVGAVPGALPPLIGWASARGDLGGGGLWLFAIQFFWQMPHFLAIAWIYQDDYAKAGFRMLPMVDPNGERTGRQSVLFALGLLGASIGPGISGLAGSAYLAIAAVLGVLFVVFALLFARMPAIPNARRLFLASIAYLPLSLVLMVLDKMRTA